MRSFILAGLFVSACQTASAQSESHALDGMWVNEAGSVVVLESNQTGALSGHYQTKLGAPDADSHFPLTGWVQGDVVAFSVNFEGFGSITSWSGQLSEDQAGPFLRTLWHYTKDIPDAEESEDLWRTINSGYAVFRPVEAPPEN
ncbi:MAG: avidin/streptavidin family protein [Pseudomonadota bacterium]